MLSWKDEVGTGLTDVKGNRFGTIPPLDDNHDVAAVDFRCERNSRAEKKERDHTGNIDQLLVSDGNKREY